MKTRIDANSTLPRMERRRFRTRRDVGMAGRRKTAFLCFRRYPAAAVLCIYDWAKEMRESGECMISGFHSALERDVLAILFKGSQPVILAAARGLPQRYPADVKKAIDRGRLLVISPFPDSVQRITADTAGKRGVARLRINIGSVRFSTRRTFAGAPIPPEYDNSDHGSRQIVLVAVI